jgi:N-acetylglucosamine-6-phosphate deacetylase
MKKSVIARRPGPGPSPRPDILIENAEIFTPARRIGRGSILMRDGRIAALGPAGRTRGALPTRSTWSSQTTRLSRTSRTTWLSQTAAEIFDARGLIAVPGFIDIHLHGGGGADFMDASPEAAARVLRTHLRKGTTSCLPTLMTASHASILAAIHAVRTAAAGAGPIPEILGFHLEGPYISVDKRGAQPLDAIRPFAARELQEYLEAAKPLGLRIVTLAPEKPGAAALIAFLASRGIVAAAGHSNATYAQAAKGLAAGIRHGTHLFNAMTGLFHRDPGLAGALLLDDRASVEIIADGIHLHPAVVDVVLRLKPRGKVVLVTDATRRAGQGTRPLLTADGKLYGSTITLDAALRNMVRWTGRPLTDILPMLTSNPARVLGLARRKGRLARGADADVVLLDHDLNVRHVFLGGKKILIAR